MIYFTCRHCNAHLQIGDEWAGRLGRCPYCGKDSPAPRGTMPVYRRSSRLGILARFCAWPVIALTSWAYFFESWTMFWGGGVFLAAIIL
jgi:hypothetical protein